MENAALTELIIGCAYNVHNTLGSGFIESVYENALVIELEKHGLQVRQQSPVNVYYEGHIVGLFTPDIIVNGVVILELKAVENLKPIHEVQLVNYLNATRINLGLLINFGSSVMIKRKYRVYRAKE